MIDKDRTLKGIIEKASCAVIESNNTKASEAAHEALDAGIDPVDVIEQGFIEGMRVVGDRFQEEKLSILQVLAASKTMNYGINILKSGMVATDKNAGFFGNLVATY